MPNSQGKARHLWCGWSEWLRMVEKNQEPGPSLWLSNRCFIQIYHNIFDWLKRSSAPMKTCWNSKHVYFIYKYTINLQTTIIKKTTTVHVWPMSGNDHVRVSQARLRLCHNFGLRESSPSISPTTHSLQLPLSAPWDTGASRSSSGANICASECSKLRRARSQTWHPSTWNILEHLGTSDPGVLRSPGVEPCLKVSAQCINVSSAGAIGCCRML